jgi:hypothetical protein
MALITIGAVVHIPAHIGVMEVGGVSAPVATRALEDRVVVGIRVTGRTDPVRVAVVDVEPRVIERRSRPCARGVTGGARRREPCRGVVRIRGAGVVRLVAPIASRRQRCVVVVHVAVCACHGGMSSREREGRSVVVKGRAGPVGRAVANIAGCRESHL